MNRKQRRAAAKARQRRAPKSPGSASTEIKLQTAVSHHQAGRLSEAKLLYAEILSREPKNIAALHLLGMVKYGEGDARQAIELIERAIALQPDCTEAYNNLGIVLKDQGRLEEAVTAYRKALKLKPGYAEAHNNLGIALRDQGRLEEAVTAYQKALKLKPDCTEAHYNLGIALRRLGKIAEAKAAYRKTLELRPDYAEALNNLGFALKDQGRLAEAMAAYRKALEVKPDFAEAQSNLILIMNYDARISQKDIFAESRCWDETHAALHSRQERTHANNRDPDRRLRVGYVSPDFREHSVSYFADPLIAGHDRRSFEVFCYAQVAMPDDKTSRFRDLADGWRSMVGATEAAGAERIREDGIDILVDLAGHTAKNRLLVFAERPAPVQVTWLGYPNTTGLSAMDYRLTDEIADPEGTADTLYTETLVRLPNGFLCFAPAADAPEIGELPALTSDHVTFGSFNNLSKVTPEVVETWARILEHVPRSRLLIKSRSLADGETRNRYLEMFVRRGIDTGRVELCSWIASKAGHLGAYDRVDIGLDPFPYNGTTTTCEALWMGVPVVTLRGDRHSSRVGASLLTRVGLPDLIAEAEAAYVETAAGLADDLDRLSELRRGLRDRVRDSPLCNGRGFAREIEAAYREMWRRWCGG
jgi:predicted O-linked N-acetylglucosamine transferase (SPINDLY family)